MCGGGIRVKKDYMIFTDLRFYYLVLYCILLAPLELGGFFFGPTESTVPTAPSTAEGCGDDLDRDWDRLD